MACCLCFFQGSSRTWLLLLVPISSIMFARFSSGHEALLISITFILFSTLFLLKFSKQNPQMVEDTSLPRESLQRTENIELSPQEDSPPCDGLGDQVLSADEETDRTAQKKSTAEDNRRHFLIGSRDSYSESESMDHYSSTSSEDHSSDIDHWPFNMGRQRLDFSDDSISDDESDLIEIAIPSGQFVSPEKDHQGFNPKRSKLSDNFSHGQESMIFQKDFLADINDMNEEDNLIEIDIYMGSIKCSRFDH